MSPRAARLLLTALILLPLAWSLYVTDFAGLDRSSTTSHLFFAWMCNRPLIAPVMFGWFCGRLAHAAFPDAGWQADALVWAGVCLGHLGWSQL